MAYRISPQAGGVGARLETDDLAQVAADPTALSELARALDRHLVLHMSSDVQVTPETIGLIARRLGYPEGPYASRPGALPGHEFIGDFSAKARPDDGRPRTPTFIEALHYDSIGSKLAAFSLLHTRDVPPGKPQLWVDMRALYATLPDDLKAVVDTHSALHGWLPKTSEPLEAAPAFDPEKAHRRPLAVRHWRTGDPILLLPKHPMSTIEGLPDDDGRELIAELWRLAHAAPARYAQVMETNDVVIWDNLATTHTNPAYRRDVDRQVWFLTIPSQANLEPAYA